MTGMSENDPYSWLAKIAPVAAPVALGWAIVRGYFALVTRKELQQALAAMERHRADARKEAEALHKIRHDENQAAFRELFGRLGSVEQSVASIQGEMRARFSAGGGHDG
jgi:hypothetical protein